MRSWHIGAGCAGSWGSSSSWGQGLMAVGGYTSISCADTGEICGCVATTAATSASASGTYSTSGDTLTTTSDGGSESAPYCVKGNTLYQMYTAPASRATF